MRTAFRAVVLQGAAIALTSVVCAGAACSQSSDAPGGSLQDGGVGQDGSGPDGSPVDADASLGPDGVATDAGCGGVCFASPPSSATCVAEHCLVTLATDQEGVGALAVDGTSVYWTTIVTGNVMKVPLGGGPPVVLATNQGGATGIVVDESYVYWTIAEPMPSGSLWRVGLDGGTPSLLVSAQNAPTGVTLDDASLYWTNEYGIDGVWGSAPKRSPHFARKSGIHTSAAVLSGDDECTLGG
jgi:hypothetical protein